MRSLAFLSLIQRAEVKGFEFTNPNAEMTCGCGNSFSV